jgi:hypothetical protein
MRSTYHSLYIKLREVAGCEFNCVAGTQIIATRKNIRYFPEKRLRTLSVSVAQVMYMIVAVYTSYAVSW